MHIEFVFRQILGAHSAFGTVGYVKITDKTFSSSIDSTRVLWASAICKILRIQLKSLLERQIINHSRCDGCDNQSYSRVFRDASIA